VASGACQGSEWILVVQNWFVVRFSLFPALAFPETISGLTYLFSRQTISGLTYLFSRRCRLQPGEYNHSIKLSLAYVILFVLLCSAGRTTIEWIRVQQDQHK
jgi:hypothetical protein